MRLASLKWSRRASQGKDELTSDRRIKANRENAEASTGPKTPHGRDRAARNALCHGLSLPVYSDPSMSKEVKSLALQIAGADSSVEIQALAHRVAEAHADVRRVRYVRHQLLCHTLSNRHYVSRRNVRMNAAFIRPVTGEDSPPADWRSATWTLAELQKFSLIIAEDSKKLLVLDRYERRALSRRKFAVRYFDKARRKV